MKFGFRWQLLLFAAILLLGVSIFANRRRTTAFANAEATRTALLAAATARAEAVAVPTTPSQIVESNGQCLDRRPANGGFVIEGIVGKPVAPNPLFAHENPVDRQLVDLIFDGLVRPNSAGLPEPALAESWEISEDGTQVTFTLRDDVFWHDGVRFSANDVAFTYGLLQSADFDNPLWSTVGISILSDRIIQFQLNEPFSPFLEATAQGILPSHLLANVPLAQLRTTNFNFRPIGTGPFAMAANWQEAGTALLTPNPAHWDAPIRVDGVEIRFFASEDDRAAALNRGEIQAALDIDPSGIPAVTTVPSIRLFTSTESRYSQLLFNLGENRPILNDIAVREALAYALDRDQLLQTVLNGQGVPFDGPYPPNSWAFTVGDMAYASNIISATSALDSAGWVEPETSTARLNTDGEPLALTLLTLEDERFVKLAEAVAEQWLLVDVAVTIMTVAEDGLLTTLSEGDFDVALLTVDPLDDPDLYDFWSQEAIVRGQNFGQWNDRRASEALEQARQNWDVEERFQFYAAFNQRFMDALPALPLYQHVTTYALSSEIGSAEIGRITHPRDRFDTLPNWVVQYEVVEVACPDG